MYLQTGRQREAVAELQKSAVESHRSLLELMYLGHALGVSGARAEGQKVLEEMQGLSRRRYVPPHYIAMVYEGLGERERALQWFEKAYAERSMNGWILPDPRLDQIRTEPRFQNLMRGMGSAWYRAARFSKRSESTLKGRSSLLPIPPPKTLSMYSRGIELQPMVCRRSSL